MFGIGELYFLLLRSFFLSTPCFSLFHHFLQSLFSPTPFFRLPIILLYPTPPHFLLHSLLLHPGSRLSSKSMEVLWLGRFRSPAQPKEIIWAQTWTMPAWKVLLWWSWAWAACSELITWTLKGKSDVLEWWKREMDTAEQQKSVHSQQYLCFATEETLYTIIYCEMTMQGIRP